MELDIKDLYKLFEDNNLSPQIPFQQQPQKVVSMIKDGDIVVTEFKGREFRGEICKTYEKNGIETYDVKVGQTIISVKFENILEHYPKNNKFETIRKEEPKQVSKEIIKPPVKKVENKIPVKPVVVESKVEPENPTSHKVDKEEQPKKVLADPKKLEKEEIEKNPDNANPTNEMLDSKKEIKVIGKVTHYTGLKLQEVEDFLTTKGIKEKCWYMVSEKNDEIHVIRNNDKGFKIQPFVLSFMEIQIKNKKLNENSSQIKIKGNNNFSIISNIPKDLYDLIRNGLIVLLSK